MPGALLVVSSRGELSVARRDSGGGWSAVALMKRASWPTWRPGPGAEFAASALLPSGASRLVVGQIANATEPLVVHESAPGEGIAPRVSHYALWSPDGSRLAYVTRSGDRLALSLLHLPAGKRVESIVEGAPIFSAWSADSRYLACHAGLSLQVVDAERGDVHRVVSEEAAGFRVAAPGPEGTLLYGIPDSGALRLLESRFEGGPARELGRFGGGIAMAVRPGGGAVAVGVTRHPQTGTFEELWLVAMGDGQKRLIARGPYVAFYWSPAGDRIALVVPAQTGDGRHCVRTISPDGAQLAASEGIVPSQDFRIALGFFDQYALSHPVWTASGSLLLTGRRVDDSVHATLGDAIGDHVFSWAGERGAPLEAIQPGQTAVAEPSPEGGTPEAR
ncbi:MAG: hypothetical protein C0506_06665 [Anaerolinea sp.]|nr:hypothetical protein [Anaerolinea sp.]